MRLEEERKLLNAPGQEVAVEEFIEDNSDDDDEDVDDDDDEDDSDDDDKSQNSYILKR